MKPLDKLTGSIAALIILFLIGCGADPSGAPAETNAVIMLPVSGITDTAGHYTYTGSGISTVIQYVAVRASNGEIKTAFNACDVCYPEHKGYSQNKTTLRCNNCGNSFKIDELGSQGSGGCWPGHLPHTIEGDSIVIKVSDLLKGEYYFKL